MLSSGPTSAGKRLSTTLANGQVLADWLLVNPLSFAEVDCATAVMLKILDGKCKMNPLEKVVMTQLYDAVCHLPGERLESALHAIIASGRADQSDAQRDQIYEYRVLAETRISRPVMKAFKARIRRAGLFELNLN